MRRDGEPRLAAIRRAINAVRAARAPAVGEVGERDVVVAEIAAADRRVGELRPDWILGGRRDDGTKQQCGENGFHL